MAFTFPFPAPGPRFEKHTAPCARGLSVCLSVCTCVWFHQEVVSRPGSWNCYKDPLCINKTWINSQQSSLLRFTAAVSFSAKGKLRFIPAWTFLSAQLLPLAKAEVSLWKRTTAAAFGSAARAREASRTHPETSGTRNTITGAQNVGQLKSAPHKEPWKSFTAALLSLGRALISRPSRETWDLTRKKPRGKHCASRKCSPSLGIESFQGKIG